MKKFNLDTSMYYPTYSYRVERLMRFYCTMFDVFEVDESGKSLARFKGLEEYVFPYADPIRNLDKITDIGDTFHTLIEWGVMANLSAIRNISEVLLGEVARMTGFPMTEDLSDYHQIFEVIKCVSREQWLINLKIPVLVRSLKSSNVELG